MVSMENHGGRLSVRRVDGDAIPSSALPALRQRLRKLGVETGGLELKGSTGEFDGFSIKEDADILPRTDRRV
jgi:hypothetical protein